MDWKNATSESSQPLPIPIQIFLWQQTSPFTRPKLGKLHESTCTFCQSAPGHHAFEKVLVQNQQFGLSPSLTEAINSIPRWRLVQGAFPHILHSTAALLHNRKENLQNLGAAESKLLYILHWIILDAAEECAEADYDKGITPTSPFYYLFSIPSITLFVYLLAPLCHQVKESDLQTFRLENGMKVWEPLWESRHPDAPCFTALAKPRRHLWPPNGKSHVKSPSKSPQFSGIFLGRKSPPKPVDLCGTGMGESPPSQTTSFGFFDQPQPLSARQTDEEGWVSSPKDTNFPETIPEESSSTEEEHVVIYRLPSIAESDGLKESSIYTTLDTSIFQAQQRLPKSPSDAAFDAQNKASSIGRGRETSGWSEEKSLSGCGGRGLSRVEASPAATLLDVGVVRCLFIPQWPEEGVYWALQFLYHRLRDVVDPKGSERQPRKRSASLPSPQLGQLSFTEASSTLEKSRLNKDFIEVPQIKDVSPRAVSEAHPSFSQKDHRHNRRASEKIKKCMKMADLKAFVETKLLSKSEKALERIGQDDSQSLYTQEYHRSLDTGDEELVRKEKSFALLVEGSTNLVKGKSMPSLSCLLDESLALNGAGYVGETSCGGGGGGGGGSERSAGGLSEWRVTEPSPNPIITVTEHTPAPSPPDFAAPRRVRLGEAWRDEGVKKRGLIRSLSDSKISYSSDDCPEAPGAAHYITPEGDIDLLVVLKGIQNVVMRENTICSLRVCEGVLNLTEVILGMPAVANANEKQHAAQTSILTSLTRVLRGLGCPQGCEDAQRGAPADFLRSQVQSLLARLHKASPQHFLKFFKRLVRRQTIPETVDFFHAFTGFCVDPGSLLSPLNKRGTSSKSPDAVPGSLFGPSATGLESNIFGAVFKIFVTKLVSHGKELKSPENMNLYCDIRLLVSYVKEVHGNVLRRVALSGLIDTAVRPHRKESNLQTTRVIRHIPQSEQDSIQDQVFIYDEKDSKKLLFKKRSTSSTCASVREADGGDDLQSPMGNMRKKHILTPRHSQRNFNHFQKNSRFRIGGLVSWFRREVRRGESLDSQQGSQTELPLPAAAVAAETGGGGGGGGGGALAHHAAQLHHSYSKTSQKSTSSVSTTLQKAKRRVEDQFTKLGFGRGKKKDGSIEETQGSYLSRRNSVETAEGRSRDSEVVVLKARRMVKKETLVQGMNRLSILLEICQPASLPHPHLLAAVLDLAHTPVVSRAAFLLECAHFVHSCNKGQWPSWLKQNLPLCRPSGPPPSARPNPATAKRSHLLQRAAGNVFYQWAEVLGQRLEEMLAEDKNMIPQVIAGLQDEQKQKELLIEDEEEDFLDEACWTRGGGEGGRGAGCPMALRLIACSLLVEITAFLRETYQSLPKVGLGGGVVGGLAGGGAGGTGASLRGGGGPGGGGGGGGGALGSAFPSSGEAKQANRRWSMALSSMGHSQASAHSLQSIPDQGQTERKISFVLQEPEESEGSSNTTLTMQVDDGGGGGGGGGVAGGGTGGGGGRSRGRAQLLRRGTATGGGGGGGGGGTGGGAGGAATVTTSTSGSFKRRSLKLRRSKEPLYESRPPLESSAPLDCMASFSHFQVRSSEHRWFKRSDSLQNRRKVSSLSDRSDTSEQGLGSGEESPGALSDAPESPSSTNETDDSSNMPWLKVIVQMLNSYNYFCSHQQFCHPFCYRRHARATSRLVKAVRKVYGEEFGMLAERRGGEVSETVGKKGGEGKRSRKVSEQVSPVRAAKESKKDKSERHDSHSNGKLLNQIDSSDKADGTKADNEKKEHPPILKYIKAQVGWGFHRGLEALVKGGCVVPAELLAESLPSAWHLCLEPSQETAATAGALFILAAVRAPLQAAKIMDAALHHPDPAVRISACLRFKVLWKMRHQVWCRMEEGAQVTFKVPPPGIEFTLPSPKIGIESLPVVDPPWMPQVKTKVEEVTAISQESHRSLVTATKTRKKQQTELIKMALQAREDKKRCERENFMVTTIPVTIQAAYEPSLHHAVGDDHEDGGCDEEVLETGGRNTHQIHSAQSLFPSCLCTAVVRIINLLDDAAVSADGSAVYEVAYQVIWSCLVEDSALFLRYILERLTRGDQELMFKVLRHLIRFVPRLPQQAAFTLYNYIIGYVMFYVRSPQEEGQKLIGAALSILWMVVHSVHGIMFKDLKQILRKEQCDASILLTANVPSTKKIIVHGPQDESACGIPSQFPVQEDTQFFQILRESLDFFSIPEDRQKEFFLVDHKTRQIHNPNSYVRDYYFFKRSQYPQLELVHMHPDDAFNALQRQELMHKSVEIGKVLLTWAILKNVDMVVQRVVFLHEELMKLPSFPRKALEADLDLYRGGQMGKELLGLDVLHKFMWVRLIARMFEAMAGNFAYSGDIRLFLNVLNGALILHSQDATILRYVMATYINAAHNFKNIFSINGYLMVVPTLLQLYAIHQTNKLVTRTVEYCVKQFYLMNRKPFILQMFGAASPILDIDLRSQFGDAQKVPAKCLFELLLSLETPSPDPLNIGELVKEEKPLKAIDFCYHDDNEMVTVLDCISLCVMVIAYSADSVRAYQMLTILEAIVPCYLQQIQLPSYRKEGKTEREIISQIAVAINTLVTNCEALAKNYSGPQRTSPDHKGSSGQRGGAYNRAPYSPGFEYVDDPHSKYIQEKAKARTTYVESDDTETEFRRPRDVLLSLATEFATKCAARLIELNKKFPQDGKQIELLELRSQTRLAEIAHSLLKASLYNAETMGCKGPPARLADIAHSLLKASPYDAETMGCKGLQLYMTQLMPATEWNSESMRPTMVMILRRLDKTFLKIYKKPGIRRNVDWDAASGLIKGIYETLSRYPYMVHLTNLKSLVNTCQSLITGEMATGLGENISSATTALMAQVPPPHFCDMVVRLIALQILAFGDSHTLEAVCGGSNVFPTFEKTESILLNLLMPLCLRVGSGRKDVHIMREVDISYCLTVVLYGMYPPSARTPVTTQNFKMAQDFRSGSFSFTKSPLAVTKSLYQVSFLALKILIACFEGELEADWPRIARTVQELAKVTDARQYFWSFIEFVVTQRPPLFTLIQPFIRLKLNMTPISEIERHIHFVVREKMAGHSATGPKCRGNLLNDLIREMKIVKDELDSRKFKGEGGLKGGPELGPTAGDPCAPPPAVSQRHRPSLIDLLTGGNSQFTALVNIPHRESVSSVPSTNTQEPPPLLSRYHTSSEVLSPGEGEEETEGGGSESCRPRPRLQRSKAQSRKTFRHRKSRIESKKESGGGEGRGSSRREDDEERGGAAGTSTTSSSQCSGGGGGGRRGESCEDSPQTSRSPPPPPPREGAAAPPPQPPPQPLSPDSSSHSQHSFLLVFEEDTLI